MQYLDCRGMQCPFPILNAKNVIKQYGLPLTVWVTDPHAPIDFKVLCTTLGANMVEATIGDYITLTITIRDNNGNS